MAEKTNPSHLRLACEARAAGLSFREVAREVESVTGVSYTPTAIWYWQKKPEWQTYAAELEERDRKAGLSRYDNYLKEFEGASKDLADTALANLRGLAIAQQKIATLLETIPTNIEIETAADVAALIRAQNDINKGLLLCHEALEKAGGLAEFMADNTVVDIQFEPYEEGEGV